MHQYFQIGGVASTIGLVAAVEDRYSNFLRYFCTNYKMWNAEPSLDHVVTCD